MTESIGKRLAEELKRRAITQAQLQQEATRKTEAQEAADQAALNSLVKRVSDEATAFNDNAGDLPHLTLSAEVGAAPYTLVGTRKVNFSLHGSKLQITVAPGTSPLLSNVIHGAKGYTYQHVGLNGMATHRESTEDEIVDDLLKQACGL